MKWSDETMEELRTWLAPGTWYKNHPCDDSRFYVFVASVWNDEHRLWDEAAAREIIANKAVELHPNSNDLAKEVAAKRISEGTSILDFLSLLRAEGRFALLSP